MILIIAPSVIFIGGILAEVFHLDGSDSIIIQTVSILLIFIFIPAAIYIFGYYMSGNSMSKLEMDYKINIKNQEILVNTLNERTKIDNQLSNAVIDAPNMGQSQRTSEVIQTYVDSINRFNEELRSARFNRNIHPTLFRFLWFGLLVPVPEGIDYIKLN